MAKNSIIVAQLSIPEEEELHELVLAHRKRCASLATQVVNTMAEGEKLRTLAFAGGFNDLYVDLVNAKGSLKASTKGSELDSEITAMIFPIREEVEV
jgi:hypothetical protein